MNTNDADSYGWVVFAGAVTAIVGFFNVIMGLAALTSEDVFVVSEEGLLVFDFTTWGVIHLIWGIVIVVTGFAILAGQEWARWVGILAVGLNAIAHVAFFPAFPLWSLVLIAVDVLVIYALTARWETAR